MQLDLTTIILELLNFAVLVWLLNRFLFRPVRAVMDMRRAEIAGLVEQAEKDKQDAEDLRQTYEDKLASWKKGQEDARAELNREIARERDEKMAGLKEALEKEKERLASAQEKKREDWLRMMAGRARTQGGKFATHFIERLSGAELDEKLAALMLEDLDKWPKDQRAALEDAGHKANGKITLVSAHDLSAATRTQLETALGKAMGRPCKVKYTTDAALVAGVRVNVGALALQANLHDDLGFFFGETAHEA